MKKLTALLLAILPCFCLMSQNCDPDSLIVRSVKANLTDNNIKWELQNHQVYYNPDCDSKGKLLVHLVGSFDNTTNTILFPSMAANMGFKVLVLKYPNGVSATGACANSSDKDCFWKYRQEINFGTDTSSEVSVDSTHSVVNRMEKLIQYLHQEYPGESWDDFLDGTEIHWPKLLLSGHSQGGGHAAFIAKQFPVSRVIMFASPNDYSKQFNAPANWLSNPSITKDSNLYAFGNLNDDVVDFYKQYENWQQLNLFTKGDTIDVDVSQCPYKNSQLLYSKDTSSTKFSGKHNAVIMDDYTPMENSLPVFLPVWKYLLGHCENLTSVHTIPNRPTLQVYPNPAKNQVWVQCKEIINTIEIYDATGKKLAHFEPNKTSIKLNLETTKGLLFIQVSGVNFGTQRMKLQVL